MQSGNQVWWSPLRRLSHTKLIYTKRNTFCLIHICTFRDTWACVCGIGVNPLSHLSVLQVSLLSLGQILHIRDFCLFRVLHLPGWSSYLWCSKQITRRKKWCKWCSSTDFYFTSKFKMNLFTWIVNKAQRTERKYCRRVNYNELDYDGEGKKVWDVTISWHQDRRHHTQLSFH